MTRKPQATFQVLLPVPIQPQQEERKAREFGRRARTWPASEVSASLPKNNLNLPLAVLQGLSPLILRGCGEVGRGREATVLSSPTHSLQGNLGSIL